MIQGKLVNLWALERHDLMQNYQWANDRELIRLAGMAPLPKSVAELERWYESAFMNPETQVFALKTPQGEYVGNIQLTDLDTRSGRAEVGILLDHRFRGRGIGTDALRTLCRFAFGELRLHRLYARVLESNTRARKTFEKCGFLQEGIEREAHYSDGQWLNAVLMGLLAHEHEA